MAFGIFSEIFSEMFSEMFSEIFDEMNLNVELQQWKSTNLSMRRIWL